MPKSPNQKMKPLLLQRILLERTDEDHGLTVPELIALLEEEGVAAERKSVYSDLQTLADFGLPNDDALLAPVIEKALSSSDMEYLPYPVTGDMLRAARGAEEIQVQVARVHGMASQFQIACIITKNIRECNAFWPPVSTAAARTGKRPAGTAAAADTRRACG